MGPRKVTVCPSASVSSAIAGVGYTETLWVPSASPKLTGALKTWAWGWQGPSPSTEPCRQAPGGLVGSLLTPGPQTSGSRRLPHFLICSHGPRAASGGGRCGQELDQLCACSAHPPSLVPAPSSLVSPPTSLCLPSQPGACPPTRLLRGEGELDEGELLGHQQDPVEALHQLQLPDAPFGGEQSAGQRRWSCHHPRTPGSSELPLTQSPPGPPRFPACLPHQSPLGQEGTTEHCPQSPSVWLRAGWTLGLMCLLVPSLGVSTPPGGRGLSLLDVTEAQRTEDFRPRNDCFQSGRALGSS